MVYINDSAQKKRSANVGSLSHVFIFSQKMNLKSSSTTNDHKIAGCIHHSRHLDLMKLTIPSTSYSLKEMRFAWGVCRTFESAGCLFSGFVCSL